MDEMKSTDRGFSHVALVVRDLAASMQFYEQFAGLAVAHRRAGSGDVEAVAWMSDGIRPFALVLIQSHVLRDTPLGPFGHLGVACKSRDEVDRLAGLANRAGILRSAPRDSGPPVGYWSYIADPDGNTLEISFGQEVELATRR